VVQSIRPQDKASRAAIKVLQIPADAGPDTGAPMLEVLYRDDALIALAKPPGRIVIPGRGAAAADPPLRDDVAALVGRPVWVVHRLDRGTSGVLLFALDADAHRALSRAFEQHDVEKRYWSLCGGVVLGSGEVDRALVPVRGGRVRVARDGEPGGKPSRTRWRALERYRDFSAVEWRPLSGRLHQVRVHAQLLGHPLAVDPYYGGTDALRVRDLDPLGGTGPEGNEVVIARVPLHAAALRFAHPKSGAPIEIEAPLPEDLARAVALLRGRPKGRGDS
jgi:tRNA pseudouridine32 synthase/23S rRNA pseudouridine746 synthase/23S rRNA pseudouridine955/2504/2580 synthase